MDVKQFLKQLVEGYLFADLDNMENIKVAGHGNCCYPMVMCVLAGIELLGTLTYPKSLSFDEDLAEIGNPQFGWYWKHFLTPTDRGRYKVKDGISDLIRSLLRNGLAHTFIAKPGIEVRKFERDGHMMFSADSRLIIDSTKFAEDFKRSYREAVRPILDGKPAVIKAHTISLKTMQDRMDELVSAYARQAEKKFGPLLERIPTAPKTLNADLSASFNLPPRTIMNIASKPPQK